MNETIEDILREMRDASNLAPSAIKADNTLLTDSYYDDECQGWLSHYADRIEAAFKREIAVEFHRNDAAFGALLDEYTKLRAAEMMEREEKREKKYEYAGKYSNGKVSLLHYEFIDPLKSFVDEHHRIVRRAVGEWEEVK